MDEYGIGSSTIYDIRKQSGQLKEFFIKTETKNSMQNRRTLRPAKLEDLDNAVYEWFQQMRSEGAPLSGPLVCEKAREFHEKMKIEEQCAFSQGWLGRFKLRHGIRRIDVSGEQKSADTLSADRYVNEFSRLVEEHGLSPDLIFNADETGLWWRCLPRVTLASGEEKVAHGFKQNKDRITVLCCANASGTCRIRLTVIGKSAKPRALKGVSNLPVHYTHQCNAWMTAEIFDHWFHHIFVPTVKNFLKKKGLREDSKVCLVLDNCRAHPPVDQLVSGNIFTVYLPPNVTSVIQPMDQGVIQNMKMHYRKDFMRKLLNTDDMIVEFQKKFNIKDAVYCVSQAWQSVKKCTLIRSWRKLWPFVNTLENEADFDFIGFSDASQDALRDSCQKLRAEISKMVKESDKLKELNEEELNEWIEVDKNLPVTHGLDTQEIIDLVMGKTPEVESSDEEEEPQVKVTWAEAMTALSTVINFAQSQPFVTPQEVLFLMCFQDKSQEERRKSIKQADIRQMFKRAAERAKKSDGAASNPVSSTPADTDPVPSISTHLDIVPSTSAHADPVPVVEPTNMEAEVVSEIVDEEEDPDDIPQ